MSFPISARSWPALAAVAAGLMLAIAHASQTFGGLEPCELCLKQREVYWAALVVGGLCAAATASSSRVTRPACLILAVIFLAEAVLAAYHAGVEWKVWPGPASCTGAGVHKITVSDMTALLKGGQGKVVQCDVAAFRLLGLSMAGWNALAAGALAALSLFFAARSPSAA